MPVQQIPSPADFPWRHGLSGPAATRRLGERLAALLQGGEILLLWGPLGAGKTCFVQGLCHGLGVTEEVTSPSFTLANRYQGRLVAHHLDFYRLDAAANLADIGVDAVLEEIAAGAAVLVAEWPLPLLPWIPSRQELLVLPGPGPEDRIWHLRGQPPPPAAWQDLWAGEDPPC